LLFRLALSDHDAEFFHRQNAVLVLIGILGWSQPASRPFVAFEHAVLVRVSIAKNPLLDILNDSVIESLIRSLRADADLNRHIESGYRRRISARDSEAPRTGRRWWGFVAIPVAIARIAVSFFSIAISGITVSGIGRFAFAFASAPATSTAITATLLHAACQPLDRNSLADIDSSSLGHAPGKSPLSALHFLRVDHTIPIGIGPAQKLGRIKSTTSAESTATKPTPRSAAAWSATSESAPTETTAAETTAPRFAPTRAASLGEGRRCDAHPQHQGDHKRIGMQRRPHNHSPRQGRSVQSNS
jgi:hypothetical protein